MWQPIDDEELRQLQLVHGVSVPTAVERMDADKRKADAIRATGIIRAHEALYPEAYVGLDELQSKNKEAIRKLIALREEIASRYLPDGEFLDAESEALIEQDPAMKQYHVDMETQLDLREQHKVSRKEMLRFQRDSQSISGHKSGRL
jgi:hypothetical protein